jgi:hypothetical protein
MTLTALLCLVVGFAAGYRIGVGAERRTRERIAFVRRVSGVLVLLATFAPAVLAADYKRADWPHWSDLDGNGCDTRSEALIAQADGPLTYADERRCRVTAGRWVDPYSGAVFTDPGKLDLDHVAALKWAHSHGGSAWARNARQAFTNDLDDNLLVVSASLNRQKGAKGPAAWLPPKGRCEYGKRFVRVVKKYKLRLPPADWRAVERACRR